MFCLPHLRSFCPSHAFMTVMDLKEEDVKPLATGPEREKQRLEECLLIQNDCTIDVYSRCKETKKRVMMGLSSVPSWVTDRLCGLRQVTYFVSLSEEGAGRIYRVQDWNGVRIFPVNLTGKKLFDTNKRVICQYWILLAKENVA